MMKIEITQHIDANAFMAGAYHAIGTLKCYPLWGMLKTYADEKGILDLNKLGWPEDQEDFMLTLGSVIAKEAVTVLNRGMQDD